ERFWRRWAARQLTTADARDPAPLLGNAPGQPYHCQFSGGETSEGNTVMPRVLSCPSGHQWEEADGATPLGGARCPVCGSTPRVSTDDAGSTVLLAPTWQPMPPLSSDVPPKIPGFEM